MIFFMKGMTGRREDKESGRWGDKVTRRGGDKETEKMKRRNGTSPVIANPGRVKQSHE